MFQRLRILFLLACVGQLAVCAPPGDYEQPRLTVDDVYNRQFVPVTHATPEWEPHYQYGDPSYITHALLSQYFYQNPLAYQRYYEHNPHLYTPPSPVPEYYDPSTYWLSEAAPEQAAGYQPPEQAAGYPPPEQPQQPEEWQAPTEATTTTTTTVLPEMVPSPTAFYYGSSRNRNQITRLTAPGDSIAQYSMPVLSRQSGRGVSPPSRRDVSGHMRCTIYPETGSGGRIGSRREGRMVCVIDP